MGDALVPLIGPGSISHVLNGTVDDELSVVEICINDIVNGAVIDTVTVEVRDELGVLSALPVDTNTTSAGCHAVDVSAATTGESFAVTLDVTDGLGGGTLSNTLRVHAVNTTWVPVPVI